MIVPPGRAGQLSRRGLLATVVAVGAATSCTRLPASDPAPTRTDVERLAADWTRAITERDRALFDQMFLGQTPGDQSARADAADPVSALWDSLLGLGLTDFAVTLDPSPIRLAMADLGVGWRVPGDRAVARHTLTLPLAHRDRWRLVLPRPVPPEPSAGPSPLWWAEPTRTRQDGQVCVIAGATVEAETVRRCVEAASAGLDEAVRLTGLDNPGIVVELPSTPQLMDRVLGDDRGSTGRLSAITWPEGPQVRTAPLRIILNPLLVNATPAAVGPVLTHEITHVLTAAPERTVPLWVAEGYAELVSRDGDVDGAWRAAEPFLARVRAGSVPRTPPSDEALTGAELSIAYGQAWALCRWLVEQTSWRQMNRWYAALSAGAGMDVALQELAGLGESEMINRWRDWIIDRARKS